MRLPRYVADTCLAPLSFLPPADPLLTPVQIDFKKLGPMVGMKNHVSASNAWAKIKKKLQAHGGEDGTDNSANGSAAGDDGETPQATPTPRKRGRGKADKADKDDDGESPMKKARGGKGGKKGKKAAEGDDGDEDGEDAAAIKAEAAEEYGELT